MRRAVTTEIYAQTEEEIFFRCLFYKIKQTHGLNKIPSSSSLDILQECAGACRRSFLIMLINNDDLYLSTYIFTTQVYRRNVWILLR